MAAVTAAKSRPLEAARWKRISDVYAVKEKEKNGGKKEKRGGKE